MLSFPNAKINIGLNILGKRPDGFHDLQTIFYPIKINDIVEIISAPEGDEAVTYSQTGIEIDGDVNDNLCIKAYTLLKKDYPTIPNIELHLHKNIPMGAGLGGGSADGAFTLQLINKKYNLDLSDEMLLKYSLQLGSDCPFFIYNKPCFATGRGEVLKNITLDLSAFKIVVINPGIHINTGWAFKQLNLQTTQHNLEEAILQPIDHWKTVIINDFEEAVFTAHPSIAAIKSTLYNHGALYASMSGSGSTVYGIFKEKPSAPFNFPKAYFQKWV